jgi:predicted Fe-S protein YdhL (DUF1289 family)
MEKTPCQRNCCLDQDDICLGCGRSLTEICGWHQADAGQKLQILAQAEQRLIVKKRVAEVLTSTQATTQASRGKPS